MLPGKVDEGIRADGWLLLLQQSFHGRPITHGSKRATLLSTACLSLVAAIAFTLQEHLRTQQQTARSPRASVKLLLYNQALMAALLPASQGSSDAGHQTRSTVLSQVTAS